MLRTCSYYFPSRLSRMAESGRSIFRSAGRLARRRPKATVLVMTLLALAGAGLGFYLFALHKWHAAQLAVEHERTVEARSHLDFCLMVWPRSIPLHLLA